MRNKIDATKEEVGNSRKRRKKLSGFWFIGDDVRDGLWASEIEDAAERLGNECRPHMETSVYIRYAVIVHPRKEK